jgi:hypothetical protein
VPSTATKRAGWVLLAFRLPREPSTPRIALWRKLKRLGVVQLLDGLVALPLDSRNREQLEWLANDVQEAGGEATVWLGQLASRDQERELVARMKDATAAEYAALIAEVETAHRLTGGQRSRTLGRLRRELHRIRARDHFGVPAKKRAERAIDDLAAAAEKMVA